MKRKWIAMVSILILTGTLLNGCSAQNSKQEPVISSTEAAEVTEEAEAQVEEAETEAVEEIEEVEEEKADHLPDGVYTANFDTDSSMFHVSEACEGKGTLTVKNGEMTIHISLGSKNIINLYCGMAEDAAKDGARLLSPTIDEVTYQDGLTEEVYGFDIPVPALNEEFDVALLGTKGKWYDHKVTVSDPVAVEAAGEAAGGQEKSLKGLEDGSYTVEITFEGGSGKAEILSPVTIEVKGDMVTATVEWNSPNYDYMMVDGEKYLPVNTEGDSVFEIPVQAFDEKINVIGDTVAMSKPHEIEYTLTFHSDTIRTVE